MIYMQKTLHVEGYLNLPKCNITWKITDQTNQLVLMPFNVAMWLCGYVSGSLFVHNRLTKYFSYFLPESSAYC